MSGAFDQSVSENERPRDRPSGARTLATASRAAVVETAGDPGLKNIVVTPLPDADEPFDAFSVEFAQQSHFFAGLTRDISCGGLFVATYRVLPVKTAVRIELEMPDGTVVQARGEVCWIREDDGPTDRCGLAISFTEVSGDTLRSISEFCRLHPPLFFDL